MTRTAKANNNQKEGELRGTERVLPERHRAAVLPRAHGM